jgi:hypothetical protein
MWPSVLEAIRWTSACRSIRLWHASRRRSARRKLTLSRRFTGLGSEPHCQSRFSCIAATDKLW